MLAKLTAKNQITIPKKIIDQMPDVRYFDVELADGVIVLKPLRIYDTDLERIRAKVKKVGLTEKSVAEAIKWARFTVFRSMPRLIIQMFLYRLCCLVVCRASLFPFGRLGVYEYRRPKR